MTADLKSKPEKLQNAEHDYLLQHQFPSSGSDSRGSEKGPSENIYLSPGEIINYLGFGKAQVVSCLFISLAFMGTNSYLESQPFLNSRLYIEMQLSPSREAVLAVVGMGGSVFAHLPVGVVADQFGRKSATILFCVLMTFWNLLTCVSESFAWIVICRMMVSLTRGTS